MKRQWQRGLTMALATLACASSAGVHARCQLKARIELPVTMVDMRAIAHVVINGKQVPLMVDSGSTFSMLTDAAAMQLNLQAGPLPVGVRIRGLAGRADMRMATVDKLQVAGGNLSQIEFLVGGNEPGGGAMGLIGRDLLSMADVEYDLPHGAIRFSFPNDECAHTDMAYWDSSTAVTVLPLQRNLDDYLPPLRTRVMLNGRRTDAVFDTGAQTLVSRLAAHGAGVDDAAMVPAGQIHGIGPQRADAWTADFGRIEIGNEVVLHSRLEVVSYEHRDAGAEMLLGIDFFLSHRIYVSKGQSKMYLTYTGGPVFALNQALAADAVAFDAIDDAGADQLARRGAAALARGDLANALADLDRACALDPASAVYRAQRALVHDALGRPQQALADVAQALALDPALPEPRYERARWRLAAHDRDGALQDLSALDGTLPAQSQLRMGMAEIYERLGEQARAIAQLDRWIPAHPNDIALPAAQTLRCWSRVQLNLELDTAIADCDAAVQTEGSNASFLVGRGWAWLRQGKFKHALDDFDRSLALRPGDAPALYGRAVAQIRSGQKHRGEADLVAAREADPGIDAAMERRHLGLAPK